MNFKDARLYLYGIFMADWIGANVAITASVKALEIDLMAWDIKKVEEVNKNLHDC